MHKLQWTTDIIKAPPSWRQESYSSHWCEFWWALENQCSTCETVKTPPGVFRPNSDILQECASNLLFATHEPMRQQDSLKLSRLELHDSIHAEHQVWLLEQMNHKERMAKANGKKTQEKKDPTKFGFIEFCCLDHSTRQQVRLRFELTVMRLFTMSTKITNIG